MDSLGSNEVTPSASTDILEQNDRGGCEKESETEETDKKSIAVSTNNLPFYDENRNIVKFMLEGNTKNAQ